MLASAEPFGGAGAAVACPPGSGSTVAVSAERLILIPGMGADERLFEPQRAGGLAFEVPRFPMPARRDDMAAFGARIRDALRLDGPCVLAGVSFGGMVAYEMARLCDARCVILIASCRSRAGIPRTSWLIERLSRVVPNRIIQRRCAASSRFLNRIENLNDGQYELIRDMSLRVPVPLLRQIGRMIVQWKPPASVPCPVHHIHGDRDRIIPLRRVSPDEVVSGGGHLINLTHADGVNGFIRRHLCGLDRPPGAA